MAEVQKDIFVGQPYLLRLNAVDPATDSAGDIEAMAERLATATSVRIIYKNADTTGYWSATIVDSTVFQVSVTGAQNNVPGVWRFQVSCIFSGNAAATPGSVFSLNVRRLYE